MSNEFDARIAPLNAFELRNSVNWGNKFARTLIGNSKPQYKSAIRHVLLNSGKDYAINVASSLLAVTTDDAKRHVERLAVRPEDVTMPMYSF